MKKNYIILFLIVGMLIGIIFSTLTQSSTFVDFEQAKKMQKEAQVIGTLADLTQIHYLVEKDRQEFNFVLQDKLGNRQKVHFNGSKPQDFEKSEQVVITGKYIGDDFYASKILMKCPSKYNRNEMEVQEVQQN